jgi:sirohydrochlorin ferrochelatase
MTATLIPCSHGTSDENGRRAIAALLDQTRALLPGIRVVEAFVDVQEPAIDDVVERFVQFGPVVVVPVLLSTGFHTRVDIARAVAAHPGRAVATPPLGPHDLLTEVLASRLAEAGVDHDDAIVLAAAGSSDPAAEDDVRAMAEGLRARVDAPVHVGFAAGAGPRIADTVAEVRAGGAARVAIASYVLAPGHFARVIAGAGGDVATPPLAPDVRIATIIADRYRDGVVVLDPASVAASVRGTD